jgi:branched-chain amino acid transport system substrate-binding protein
MALKLSFRRAGQAFATAIVATALISSLSLTSPAVAADPLKIGFGMALTGGLASNGKSALLAMQIWRDDINAKGGLLGRPVELVYYDDQSTPSTVPGIYTKLLAVDKVDLVVGPYATAQIAPAMPIIIQKKKTFIALFGTAVNANFNYPRFFIMHPEGPHPRRAMTEGFFEIAKAQNPKPQTVAIIAADQEFAHNIADGARLNAKAAGIKIVYDRTYPPSTVDFGPTVQAIKASGADLVLVASYPPDSVGIIRAANEIGLKPKMFGGAMVGLQTTSIMTQLGPLLNGIINFDYWRPTPTMMSTPGVAELLKKYQAKATAAGVDPLGYYMAPFTYAELQILGDAVQATKTLDDETLAKYIHKTTFKTVVGNVTFGPDGEWASSRVLQVQFRNITGNDIEQFRDPQKTGILTPAEYKTGDVIYPYSAAQK